MRKSNLRQSYKDYSKIDDAVDMQTYLKITGDYNKFLIRKVLEGNLVTLPSRMGSLSIIGRKEKVRVDEEGNITGLAPDWVKTKELWDSNPEAKEKKTLLYHKNSHTDGYRYKFVWSKNRVLVENKTLYALRLTRENKRSVYDNILTGIRYKTL